MIIGIKRMAKKLKYWIPIWLYTMLIVIFAVGMWTVAKYTFGDVRGEVESNLIKEYNYLKSTLDKSTAKKIEETDGLTGFKTSEWPMMTLSFFCYGARNLAIARPELKPEISLYMRKAIDRAMTPEYYHFIVSHYGDPFKDGKIKDNAFYLGHFVMMLSCYREVAEDGYYDELYDKFALSFFENIMDSQTASLESYRGLTWTSEQVVPLRALAIHHKLFSSGYYRAVVYWQDTMVKKFIVDGLMVTMLDKNTGSHLEGPRAIPNTFTILYMHDILPDFSEILYKRIKETFLIKIFRFPAFKEFMGPFQHSTGDTGPIIFGAAPSSTAFGLGCAAIYGDSEVFTPISLLVDCFGMPVEGLNKRKYLFGGAIGTSAVFMLRSLILLNDSQFTHISAVQSGVAFSFYFILLIFCIFRLKLMFKLYKKSIFGVK